MNSKSTWIWITIAAVLFAAVLGVEKYWRKAPPGLVALLPDFNAAEVTSVQFAPPGQLEIRAERTNQTWRLVKPVSYPAQAASIQALLQALERLAPAYTISASALRERKNTDAEFGFDLDKRTTLTLNLGELRKQLILGARTAPGDQIYVQLVGSEGVFVVDARLLQLLPAKVDDWRDTGLVDLRHLTFDHLVVSNASTVLHLKQESTNSLWRLTHPMSARADNYRLMELLQLLQTTRVIGFVSDEPREVESFGLNAPELELSLIRGTNVLTAIQFGKSPTNDSTLVYARRTDFPTIVTVERRAIEPWLAPLEKFRDPRLVTPQPNQPVTEIAVTGPENFVLQRVATNAWKLADSSLPIDAGFVGQFLLTLVAAPIVEFKDAITDADLLKYGLAEPERRIVLQSKPANAATNTTIAQLSFGAVKENIAYARRADENPVYGIARSDYERLAIAPWQLRDRQIWRFSETNVVRLTVQQAGQTIDVRRLGVNSWAFAPGSQGILNGGAVEETVHRFGELEALAWIGRGPDQRERFGFGANTLTVTFELKDGTKHVIEFGGRSVDNYPYAAVQFGTEIWFFECPLVAFELLKFSLLNTGNTR